MELRLDRWLDNTKIGCLERCPREFFWRHVLYLIKEEALTSMEIAQRFGSVLHEVLEQGLQAAVHQGKPLLEACLEQWHSLYPRELAPLQQQTDDYRLLPDTGEALIRAFCNPQGGALWDFLQMVDEVIGVELEIEAPLPHQWRFIGRADIVARLKMGEACLADIKTTGWRISSWSDKMMVDTQLHSYAWALSTMGYTPYSATYIVGYVQRRRLKSGAYSPNISVETALFPTACSAETMRKMEWRAKQAALEVEGRFLTGSFPCRFSACLRFSNICMFHPLCERFWQVEGKELYSPSILEFALSLGYTQQEWHPWDTDNSE